MVIDSSALLAILFAESEAEAMVGAIASDDRPVVGAPTWVEASAVMLARKGSAGVVALDALLERLRIDVIPMSVDAARLARLAYERFGQGIGEPAVLNYDDCLSYGVAMAEGSGLLCKGDDFSRTDVELAPY